MGIQQWLKTKQLVDGLNATTEDDTRAADRKRCLRKDHRILKEITEFEWIKKVAHVTPPIKATIGPRNRQRKIYTFWHQTKTHEINRET